MCTETYSVRPLIGTSNLEVDSLKVLAITKLFGYYGMAITYLCRISTHYSPYLLSKVQLNSLKHAVSSQNTPMTRNLTADASADFIYVVRYTQDFVM